jgi:hypothetical protein
MTDILDKLRGGDLRSIGRANEVAQEVVHSPDLLASVFAGLLDNDPVVRMRAADAVEKASTRRPALLQPFKRELLGRVGASEQKEVRWHVALMLPRLGLNSRERRQAVAILLDYLEDTSSIVKTFAMQGLADLALHRCAAEESSATNLATPDRDRHRRHAQPGKKIAAPSERGTI